jgi:TonB family protein
MKNAAYPLAALLLAGIASLAAASDNASVPTPAKTADQLPIAMFQSRPFYPFDLRKQGVQGNATVEFVIDDKGSVVEARVIKTTNEEFGWSAVACVAKWKFRPGIHDGHAVYTKLQVPIVFVLNPS